MKIVLDTNVFVSGIFFTGPPHSILRAWRDGKVQFVLSWEILDEYQRVGNELSLRFPGVAVGPFLDLLVVEAEIYSAPPLPQAVATIRMMTSFLPARLRAMLRVL